MIFSAGTKCRAGNDGYFFFLDQFFTEFFTVHTRAADIGEDVKSAFRFKNGKTHIDQAFINDFTPCIVFLTHRFHVSGAVPESGDAAVLGLRIGTHDHVLVQLQDIGQAVPRGTDIAHMPVMA